MARVEFPPPADLTQDSLGNVLSGRSVTAKLAGTATNVTHYSALTGGTSTTGGLFTYTDGTIVDGSNNRRYVDSGITMDITIAGRSRQVEAMSAADIYPLIDDRGSAPAKRTAAGMALQLANYITGGESAATQKAGIDTIIAEAISRGKREIHFGKPYSGAAEFAISGGEIQIPSTASGLRLLGRGARIVQQTWDKYHFDHPYRNAEAVEFDHFELAYTGAMTNTVGSYRADAGFIRNSGIYVCGNGARITRIRGEGRAALVYLSNWDETGGAKSGYVDGVYLDDVHSKATNNCGVLAIGQENAYIGAVDGTQTDSVPGVTFPGHLVYISDNQPNRNITGGDWRAYGGDNHAYTIKGTTGGSFAKMVGRAGKGLLTMSSNRDLQIASLVATDDHSPTASCTVQMGSTDNDFVEIVNCVLASTDDTHERFVNLIGDDCKIRNLTIDTSRGTYNSAFFEVMLYGNRCRIDNLNYYNANASISRRLMSIPITYGSGGHRVHIAEARNVHELCVITSGAPTDLSVDPFHVSPAADAFTSTLVTNNDANSRYRPSTYRFPLTISAGGTYTLDMSRGTTRELTITTASAVTLAAPNAGSCRSGDERTIEVFNNSGGALGAFTWNAVFSFVAATAPTAPANGKRIRVTFMWDGTNWLESGRSLLP